MDKPLIPYLGVLCTTLILPVDLVESILHYISDEKYRKEIVKYFLNDEKKYEYLWEENVCKLNIGWDDYDK